MSNERDKRRQNGYNEPHQTNHYNNETGQKPKGKTKRKRKSIMFKYGAAPTWRGNRRKGQEISNIIRNQREYYEVTHRPPQTEPLLREEDNQTGVTVRQLLARMGHQDEVDAIDRMEVVELPLDGRTIYLFGEFKPPQDFPSLIEYYEYLRQTYLIHVEEVMDSDDEASLPSSDINDQNPDSTSKAG